MSPAMIERKLKEARDLLADEDFVAALARFEELTRLRPDSREQWRQPLLVSTHRL